MPTFVFPGQGSQQKGMGKDLFARYPDVLAVADRVLGYSVSGLCLDDPKGLLNDTQFTQPALYVVNALTYFHTLESNRKRPDYLAGHSLGEYNALLAAEVVDFETGLRLVQKRGELMARVKGGGMAAIVGLSEGEIERILAENSFTGIDLANRNTPSQFVISGLVDEIQRAKPIFESAGAKLVLPLRVSAPFHSRHMADARNEFSDFLSSVRLSPPKIPVISNVQARAYPENGIHDILADQITSSVRWTETIQYLIALGETDFAELGPGSVLTGLIKKIQQEAPPLEMAKEPPHRAVGESESSVKSVTPDRPGITAGSLGSAAFREHYKVRYAYVAGSMYKGISSKEMVLRMAKAGMLAFLGTGGVSLQKVEEDLRYLRAELNKGQTFGANLLCNLIFPTLEDETVDLFLRNDVRCVEAAAYMQMTPSLVRFRLKNIHRGRNGEVVVPNNILAKASRPEVAEAFMSPPPANIVEKLVRMGAITNAEAELSKGIPMAWDVCVESDSGGHTDQGIASVLMPAILRLRDSVMNKYRYPNRIRIGAAGGIGAPEAAAAAFILGADFILTGSINQCTVEAGTSDAVKDMLQDINVQHTDYAPAGDMFELGARVQVLRRGVLFPARANKLYDLYMHHNSLADIDESVRKQIQEKYFKRSFDEVWRETREFYLKAKPDEIEKAERSPKHKMSLIFRWYFVHTMRIALSGEPDQKTDYQVHCGPALGAFNQWVKGTHLENWRRRHVDELAEQLMHGTVEVLRRRFQEMQVSGLA
jgi:trans-AT polyketide synthase/acyltransferase/oxidoreductase domain-containing protein